MFEIYIWCLKYIYLTFEIQTAVRKQHSTETALLLVNNDILTALDSGQYTLLILLDLSAAFDTIDHTILLQRLSNLGVGGCALQWLRSYLTDRFQSVSVNGKVSASQLLRFGVPQGSVLGPLLFTIYISPLGQLIRRHHLKFHQYADDNQLYLSFKRPNLSSAVSSTQECVNDIKQWMTHNKLKLNDSKTEVIVIRSKFDHSPQISDINICSSAIVPSHSARNIGVIFDDTYTFKEHIMGTCRTIHFFLRKIGRIRKFLSTESCSTVVHAVISSKLDYCNSLLYGLPHAHLKCLQRAQNTAARIVTRTRKSHHITPALKKLHWLSVSYRIDFKLLLITYKWSEWSSPTVHEQFN